MDAEHLQKRAAMALDHHERSYGTPVPESLRKHYQGDVLAHHHRAVRQDIPSWECEYFQLALTPPSWLDKGDDAISGPNGEWPHAKHFVPIFVAAESTYVVVDIRTPDLQVGWFEEGTFRESTGGFTDGVLTTGKGLDDFLANLLDPATLDVGEDDYFEAIFDLDPEFWDEDFDFDGPRVFDLDT